MANGCESREAVSVNSKTTNSDQTDRCRAGRCRQKGVTPLRLRQATSKVIGAAGQIHQGLPEVSGIVALEQAGNFDAKSAEDQSAPA